MDRSYGGPHGKIMVRIEVSCKLLKNYTQGYFQRKRNFETRQMYLTSLFKYIFTVYASCSRYSTNHWKLIFSMGSINHVYHGCKIALKMHDI